MATWIWIILAITSSLMAEEIDLQKFCESKDLTSQVQKLCKMQCENDIITSETNRYFLNQNYICFSLEHIFDLAKFLREL